MYAAVLRIGSVVVAIVEETAAVALDIYIDNVRNEIEGERGRDRYRTGEFALLHRLESLGDRVADFNAALFEFLSGSPKARVLFNARGELGKN